MNGLDDLDSDILTSLRRRRRSVYGQPDVSAPPQDEGYTPSPEMLAASAGGAEAVEGAQLPTVTEATNGGAPAAPDRVRRIRLPEMVLSTVPPELRDEGGEGMSALQAQLAGIKGPADAAGLDVGDEFSAFLQARGGNTLPGAAARVDAEAQKEATADVERAVAGASNTSRATSTDGDEDKPNRDDYAKRAALAHLFNVAPALFGRRTQQVEDPDAQYRADMAAFLSRRQQREATAAQQRRQARLDELAELTEGRKAKEFEAETAQKAGKEAAESEREKRRREEADREYELKKRADERATAEAARRAAGAGRTPQGKTRDEREEEKRRLRSTEGMPFGYELEEGANPSKSQRESLADAIVERDAVTPSIDEMEQLTKGGLMRLANPSTRKQLAQVAQQIGASIRKIENLGVPSGPDMRIQLELIGDPGSAVNEVADVMPKLMANLRRYLDTKVEAKLRGFGVRKRKEPAASTAKQPSDGGAVGVVSLRRKQKDGSVEEAELHDATPRDIEEAKADGWEVLP
jgi:hypothetical protein